MVERLRASRPLDSPKEAAMPLTAGTRLGPYEVMSSLGAGGMGEVYRARDTQLKREVALKVLPAGVSADTDRLARFKREAELLAVLNHPHIAQIYGAVGEVGVRAIVMELVERETLAERIEQTQGSRLRGCPSTRCFRSRCSWPTRWSTRTNGGSFTAT
jgi:serine/threonine protein kinase